MLLQNVFPDIAVEMNRAPWTCRPGSRMERQRTLQRPLSNFFTPTCPDWTEKMSGRIVSGLEIHGLYMAFGDA